MIQQKIYHTDLYFRLVALWVICEAFAGGLMHATNIPFTGMVVSSLAVSCIILIAFYIPSRKAILKATLIVAFFKLMLSPHSPPTAYIAVFFQGYLGYILFNHRKHFLLSCVALSVAALVESALQRILVLLIIYGKNFWQAVDMYIQKTTGGNFEQYSAGAACLYIFLHLCMGLFVGITLAKLVRKSEDVNNITPYLIAAPGADLQPEVYTKFKKRKLKISFIVLWLIITGFYLQAVLQPGNAILPANKVVMIFMRSLLIILTWYLIFSPLCMALIKRFVKGQGKNLYLPIKEIQQLIPAIQYIFFKSWQLSGTKNGMQRIKYFFRFLLINIIHSQTNVQSIK